MSKVFDFANIKDASTVYVVNSDSRDGNVLFSWDDQFAKYKLPSLDLLVKQAKAIGDAIDSNEGVVASPETKNKIRKILGYE